MNRYFRRMQAFGKRFSARRTQGEMVDKSGDVLAATRPPDQASARAKSSRHGKSTADKWNQ
jgi:hypothetical protein